MNMYLHELQSMRKSTIIWTFSIIALAAIYFSVYPGIAKDAADFKRLLYNYPAPIRAAFGISLNSISSILGFYSMIFSFIVLCGAIQAMILGTSVLSKEGRERTADFLLVKPVSRPAIVSAKLLSALTMILVTNILYYSAAFAMASIVKQSDFSSKLFLMVNLSLLFIQIIFLSLGMVTSVFFKKIKSVLPLSLGVVFGLYIAGALVAAGGNDSERFISPFRYFDTDYIIKNAGYETRYLVISAVIVVISIAASYIIYSKKDIPSVS